MLEIKGEPFVRALEALASVRTLIEHSDGTRFSGHMNDNDREFATKYIRAIAKAANSLDAKNTRREAKFICDKLADTASFDRVEFSHLIDGLSRSLKGEIGASKVFALERSKAGYYGQVATL